MPNCKLIAMIPARMGSKRIPHKNIRYIDGKPLIAHAIELAVNSGCFDSVWVNSEDEVLGELAVSLGAKFHKRPPELATDFATNREFTEEFLQKHECDYVVMVNTTSPTLRLESLRGFCELVRQGQYATVLTTIAEQAETFYEFKPLNFSLDEKVNSQLLTPVEKVVWAMTAWRRATFLDLQQSGKNPIFGGNLTTFKIPKDESCDLDTEEDWKIADGILRSRSLRQTPQYYSHAAKANPNDLGSTPGSFSDYVDYVKNGLDKMLVLDGGGKQVDRDAGIQEWARLTLDVYRKSGKVFFAGNGASATMAEHMSADLYKNGNLQTVSCAETAYLTAIGNDLDFAEIFAFKIKKSYTEDDLLITISSSGSSENIVRAIEEARAKNGRVVTLSGFKYSNKSLQQGDLNFFVPSLTYGAVEVAHSGILHCWLDQYLLMLNAYSATIK
jgi:CMP-N-acetylneuraminic acid synthetase/phosphoheptose isomerase